MQNEALATIAVLGGTGKEGGGLALRGGAGPLGEERERRDPACRNPD